MKIFVLKSSIFIIGVYQFGFLVPSLVVVGYYFTALMLKGAKEYSLLDRIIKKLNTRGFGKGKSNSKFLENLEAKSVYYNSSKPCFKLPQLDESQKLQFRVKSESENGVFYDVDLSCYSCTCPDFNRRRSYYLTNDLRRICKHQTCAIFENNFNESFDELSLAILTYKVCWPNMFKSTTSTGRDFAVIEDPKYGNYWVIARKARTGEKAGLFTGKYEMYFNCAARGYNGCPPPSAREISKFVKKIRDQRDADYE